jgi:hypothetical protein
MTCLKEIVQVIDQFHSEDRLVLTVWDLSISQRKNLRLSKHVDFSLGEVLCLEKPKIRRLHRSDLDDRMMEKAILPVVDHFEPEDEAYSLKAG